jgi:hypothetical protein
MLSISFLPQIRWRICSEPFLPLAPRRFRPPYGQLSTATSRSFLYHYPCFHTAAHSVFSLDTLVSIACISRVLFLYSNKASFHFSSHVCPFCPSFFSALERMKIISQTVATLCATLLLLGLTNASSFYPARPPAIPLAVKSPYLNAVQRAGCGNGGYLAGQYPTFWA